MGYPKARGQQSVRSVPINITENTQFIIFADAERAVGVDDLVVTFCRNRFHDRCPWSEYKSIGPEATAAVVNAGWSCSELDRIAASLHEGRFDEQKLDQLRREARKNRRRISYRNLSDPQSVFE